MPTMQEELNALVNKIQDNSNGTVLESPINFPASLTQAPVTAQAQAPVIPKVEVPVVQAPVVTYASNGVVDQWDDDAPVELVAEIPVVPSGIDYSEFAKVLGSEDIKTKEDLVRAVTSYKAKAEEVSSIPADLAKAAEIARNGGNYLEYLNVTSVAWDKEDPITLYENYVTDQYQDASGHIDFEKVDKFLDAMDDDKKEFEGRKLQKQYISIQAQQKANLEYQARQQRANFEQSVRSELDKLDNIAGYKVTSAHKAELYNLIVSGKDLEAQNIGNRVQNAFKNKYFDKIDNFRKSQGRHETLSKLLDEAQVPDLRPSVSIAGAEPEKPYNALKSWMDNIKIKN